MLKPKLLLDYLKSYTNEMKKLVLQVPEEYRILLPDPIVSNQEIDVYITKETGILIDYVGLNSSRKITIHSSDLCFDDLVFSPTENQIPSDQGAIKLKPLAKTKNNEPITTLSFLGDLNGIVLFKIKGGGHFIAYDQKIMSARAH